MENKVFEFNSRVYRQKLGTVIGTKFAPAYAYLFMSSLEEHMLDGFEFRPMVWYRYIDDAFFIWTHGYEQLAKSVEYINSYHPTIKFTTRSSDIIVSFLDVLVTRKEGVLETDLYCKPIDIHQYWQKTSCHPGHVKRAIPYSQALRIRRICSDEEKFKNKLEDLVGWLVQRGYKESIVREQVAHTNSLDRATLLSQESRCNEEREDRIPFVVSYHPALSELRGLVSRLQNMSGGILGTQERVST